MGTKKEIKIKSKASGFLLFCFFAVLAYLIYNSAFFSNFFQDDWFSFKVGKASGAKDFLRFFLPRTDVIYYRPLGMQIYFFIMNKLFGFNYWFYRLSALILHAINGLLVFYLLMKLGFNKLLGIVGGLIYVTSAVNYIPFYWSSTFPFILGPSLFMLSFLFFFNKDKFNLSKIISFLFFLAALLTFELAVVLPFIIFIWEYINNKSKLHHRIVIYFLPLIPYMLLRLFVFPINLEETYAPSINLLSTLRSYLLWSLNWPEEISRQMVGYFSVNKLFMRDFGKFVNVWIFSSLLIVLFVLVLIIIKKKRFQKIIDRVDIISFSWGFLCLLPMLIFSNHVFPYYLPLALVGFIIFFVNQLSYFHHDVKNNFKLIPILIFIFIWICSSLTTVQFNNLVHWAPKRAKQVDKIIQKTKHIPVNKPIIINIIPEDYRYALNDQDALQILFKTDMKTIYGYLPENEKIQIENSTGREIISIE